MRPIQLRLARYLYFDLILFTFAYDERCPPSRVLDPKQANSDAIFMYKDKTLKKILC